MGTYSLKRGASNWNRPLLSWNKFLLKLSEPWARIISKNFWRWKNRAIWTTWIIIPSLLQPASTVSIRRSNSSSSQRLLLMRPLKQGSLSYWSPVSMLTRLYWSEMISSSGQSTKPMSICNATLCSVAWQLLTIHTLRCSRLNTECIQHCSKSPTFSSTMNRL